jgi:hypothetical protein
MIASNAIVESRLLLLKAGVSGASRSILSIEKLARRAHFHMLLAPAKDRPCRPLVQRINSQQLMINKFALKNFISYRSADGKLLRQPGKQNVFYYELANTLLDSNDLAKGTTATEVKASEQDKTNELYKRIPVVLLLGWAGAEDKHLKKYSDIYAKMGYHTIRFSPSNNLTFWSTQKQVPYAYELLDLMKNRLDFSENPLLVHAFSNASLFIVYKTVIEEANKKNSPYEFFKRNQRGIIFDSCPGFTVNPFKLMMGIADLLEPHSRFWIVRNTISSLIVSFGAFYWFFHFKEHFDRMYTTLLKDERMIPTLVLYSKKDKLIAWDRIAKFIDEKKQLFPSMPLKSVLYDDADHVLIYAKHPEDYLKHIREHIYTCKLNIDFALNSQNSKAPDNQQHHREKSKL